MPESLATPPLAVLALALPLAALPQPQYVAGQTYWGVNAYVEYVAGSAPIVVSAGHGGYLRPAVIPDRTWGTTSQDLSTQELARELARAITAKSGRTPHLVISHLHRIKLDPNRAIGEAAQGNPIAEQAWREYHGFLTTATTTVMAQWGKGHYLDIHGHGHPQNWTELGYLLDSSDLAKSDAQLASATYIDKSSIRALGSAPGVSFPNVLRGAASFGGLLQGKGYSCVPSPAIPSPGASAYFSGGYSTQQHGAQLTGTVDATQVELPLSIRGTAAQRTAFANDLADAASSFFLTNYGIDPMVDPRITVVASDPWGHETGDPAAFTITRTGDTSASLTVGWVVSGRATPGSDYAALGATVTIPAQQAAVTIPVRPTDDSLGEGTETVTVHLTVGGAVGWPCSASVVLADDEADPDLQAYWALDASSEGSCPDSSGNGRHGTLQPSAVNGPQWTPARFHDGLLFDERDDWVALPGFPYAGAGDVTLAFWFKALPSSQSGYQYVFAHGAYGQPESLHFYLDESTALALASLHYRNDNLGSLLPLQSTAAIMDDRWHHAALVARARGLCELWVDGAQEAAAVLAGDVLAPTGGIQLGNRSDLSATRYFGGTLDDVRVIGRALEAAELQALLAHTPGRFTSLGAGCAGSAGTPALAGSGVPAIGNVITLLGSNAAPAQAGALALGRSATAWNGVPLPLDLGPLGAPGCAMVCGPDLLVAAVADPAGTITLRLAVPSQPALIGLSAYAQAWLLDPRANALGAALSNGLELFLGSSP